MASHTINPRAAPGGQHLVSISDVWTAIDRIAKVPSIGAIAAIRVWSFLWLCRDAGSGDVQLTRSELSNLVGLSVSKISRIVAALEREGLLTTRRERIPGTQGRGNVIIKL